MFSYHIIKVILLMVTISLISETGATSLKSIFVPISNNEKQVNVHLPIETLMSNDKECPRLQDMGEKLLNDTEYCDVKIEVIDPRTNHSKIFCAHKSVLCMRSSVLAEKLKFLIGIDVTSKPIIKLPGIQPIIFKNILKFLYTDKLWPDFELKENIMDLYLAAQILNITDLVKITEDYLYSSVTITDASNYLKWAHKHKLVKIKTFILDFARNTLNLSKSEWRLFLKNICEANGYTLSSSTTYEHFADLNVNQ